MRAAAAAVLVLVLALPAGAAQPRRATLKLVGLQPLVVKGMSFGKRERVGLTASAPGAQRILGVAADRSGAFTARFNLRLGRCDSVTVRAVGTRGSRAILQVEPACRKNEKGNGEGPAERALARFDPQPELAGVDPVRVVDPVRTSCRSSR